MDFTTEERAFRDSVHRMAETHVAPIAAEMKRLTADEAYVDSVLIDGADRARAIASETMAAVKDIVGFIHKK